MIVLPNKSLYDRCKLLRWYGIDRDKRNYNRKDLRLENDIIDSGFIDTFREFTKAGGHYSWWSYMFQARTRDIGWRIDYFCISKALRSQLLNSYIRSLSYFKEHLSI